MPGKGSYIKNVKKIAILRANALGDFIVTLPAIQAIRAAYPSAEIILLGKPWHHEFLKGKRTPVDRVIIIPVTKGLREEPVMDENPDDLKRFFEEIKKEKIDIAIHFHGKGIMANPFLKNTGAKITVGLTCPEAEQPDRSVDFYYYQNEVMRYLEVASLIGAKPVTLEPQIKILAKDQEEAREFLGEKKISFITLHPFGTDVRRMWSYENFIEVANALAEKKIKIIFTGSSDDNKNADEIIHAMKYPAVNACGKLSLGGTAALFSMSRLMIGIDTGPLHLARAVGARTVGIYWAPNLINWGPLSRHNHRPVISWELQCPQCGIIPNDPYPFEPAYGNCSHSFSFIRNITPQNVLNNAEALLCSRY
jgi:ADP-heptose:LPS heptosyltransferase